MCVMFVTGSSCLQAQFLNLTLGIVAFFILNCMKLNLDFKERSKGKYLAMVCDTQAVSCFSDGGARFRRFCLHCGRVKAG